jgi:hypothetical protein
MRWMSALAPGQHQHGDGRAARLDGAGRGHLDLANDGRGVALQERERDDAGNLGHDERALRRAEVGPAVVAIEPAGEGYPRGERDDFLVSLAAGIDAPGTGLGPGDRGGERLHGRGLGTGAGIVAQRSREPHAAAFGHRAVDRVLRADELAAPAAAAPGLLSAGAARAAFGGKVVGAGQRGAARVIAAGEEKRRWETDQHADHAAHRQDSHSSHLRSLLTSPSRRRADLTDQGSSIPPL